MPHPFSTRPRTRLARLAGLLWLTAGLLGCSATRGTPEPQDARFVRSPAELATLKQLARAGDADAAYLVFLHYSLGLRDAAAGEEWLHRSAAHLKTGGVPVH